MKRYTSSQLRSRLAEVLDAAERGESVVIERKGTRFALKPLHANRASRGRPPILFDVVDPTVAEGQWTWRWAPRGLTFKARRNA